MDSGHPAVQSGNSVILILIGSALAFTDGGFRPVVALLCLVFAVTMQCTANLVNDLCDFLKEPTAPTDWVPTALSPKATSPCGR